MEAFKSRLAGKFKELRRNQPEARTLITQLHYENPADDQEDEKNVQVMQTAPPIAHSPRTGSAKVATSIASQIEHVAEKTLVPVNKLIIYHVDPQHSGKPIEDQIEKHTLETDTINLPSWSKHFPTPLISVNKNALDSDAVINALGEVTARNLLVGKTAGKTLFGFLMHGTDTGTGHRAFFVLKEDLSPKSSRKVLGQKVQEWLKKGLKEIEEKSGHSDENITLEPLFGHGFLEFLINIDQRLEEGSITSKKANETLSEQWLIPELIVQHKAEDED